MYIRAPLYPAKFQSTSQLLVEYSINNRTDASKQTVTACFGRYFYFKTLSQLTSKQSKVRLLLLTNTLSAELPSVHIFFLFKSPGQFNERIFSPLYDLKGAAEIISEQ